jgi:hypothetical protein
MPIDSEISEISTKTTIIIRYLLISKIRIEKISVARCEHEAYRF